MTNVRQAIGMNATLEKDFSYSTLFGHLLKLYFNNAPWPMNNRQALGMNAFLEKNFSNSSPMATYCGYA